jgi:hypothetical protein
MPVAGSHPLGEKRVGILQIGGIEPLGEPAANGRQEIARFSASSLLPLQSREAHRGAQFERFRFLVPRNAE